VGEIVNGALATSLARVCLNAGALFGWLGVGMLALGGSRALGRLLSATLRGASHVEARLELGRYLALSLEFLVAKDVLESMVEPSWDELGKLAAIVVLRTAIQLSLSRELREVSAGTE
jgi:uncharacterized membrane protein